MYAYIKENKLAFISSYELEELPETADEMIEYSEEITNPIYENGQIVQGMSEEEKRRNAIQNIITSEILDTTLVEGIEITDKEIGDIILERVFQGNPHGQMAMMTKLIANPAYATTPEVVAKLQAINKIRDFFRLSPIIQEGQEEANP